jgi:hypothetical protein
VDKIYAVVGALSIVVLPVGFVMNLCYDLNHPELWSDWEHDPRIYGTAAILALPLFLWALVRKYRN